MWLDLSDGRLQWQVGDVKSALYFKGSYSRSSLGLQGLSPSIVLAQNCPVLMWCTLYKL